MLGSQTSFAMHKTWKTAPPQLAPAVTVTSMATPAVLQITDTHTATVTHTVTREAEMESEVIARDTATDMVMCTRSITALEGQRRRGPAGARGKGGGMWTRKP